MPISRGRLYRDPETAGRRLIEGMKWGSDVAARAIKLKQQEDQLRIYEKEVDNLQKKRQFDMMYNFVKKQVGDVPGGLSTYASRNPELFRSMFSLAGLNQVQSDEIIKNIAKMPLTAERQFELLDASFVEGNYYGDDLYKRIKEYEVVDDQEMGQVSDQDTQQSVPAPGVSVGEGKETGSWMETTHNPWDAPGIGYETAGGPKGEPVYKSIDKWFEMAKERAKRKQEDKVTAHTMAETITEEMYPEGNLPEGAYEHIINGPAKEFLAVMKKGKPEKGYEPREDIDMSYYEEKGGDTGVPGVPKIPPQETLPPETREISEDPKEIASSGTVVKPNTQDQTKVSPVEKQFSLAGKRLKESMKWPEGSKMRERVKHKSIESLNEANKIATRYDYYYTPRGLREAITRVTGIEDFKKAREAFRQTVNTRELEAKIIQTNLSTAKKQELVAEKQLMQMEALIEQQSGKDSAVGGILGLLSGGDPGKALDFLNKIINIRKGQLSIEQATDPLSAKNPDYQVIQETTQDISTWLEEEVGNWDQRRMEKGKKSLEDIDKSMKFKIDTVFDYYMSHFPEYPQFRNDLLKEMTLMDKLEIILNPTQFKNRQRLRQMYGEQRRGLSQQNQASDKGPSEDEDVNQFLSSLEQ